jgi:hypothetical protein
MRRERDPPALESQAIAAGQQRIEIELHALARFDRQNTASAYAQAGSFAGH